ncbi:MAG: hypothetical protein R3C39_04075 [Dehalococcoidia bacterium]
MKSAPSAVRGIVLAGVMFVALVLGSVLTLAPRCDREIGDETDAPPVVAIAKTVCGAQTLFDGD